MSSLKKLQEELLETIMTNSFAGNINSSLRPGGKLSNEKCIETYHNDYLIRLSNVLGDNFRSIKKILGPEKFKELTQLYITQNPSKLYDLNDYGESFPKYLNTEELPYLAPLANLEIQFRKLFNGKAQRGLEVNAFSDISDISKIIFTFIEPFFLSKSEYPIYRIWEKKDDEDKIKIDKRDEFFLMYNAVGTVEIKFLSSFQYLVLHNLSLGKNLEESLISTTENSEEEITQLFSFLVSNSLIFSYK